MAANGWSVVVYPSIIAISALPPDPRLHFEGDRKSISRCRPTRCMRRVFSSFPHIPYKTICNSLLQP